MRCIGFPFCEKIILDTEIACPECWDSAGRRRKGRRLRSEFLAAHRSFKGTRLYNEAKKRLEDYLHSRLAFSKKKKENIQRFTIVR